MKHIVILYPKTQIKANMIKLNHLLACLTILKGINAKTAVAGAKNHYQIAQLAYNLLHFRGIKNIPKANCAPQFQMLNKNYKGLAFASWAGFGRINNVLQEYKKLKFLYLSSKLGELPLRDVDKSKYKLIILK